MAGLPKDARRVGEDHVGHPFESAARVPVAVPGDPHADAEPAGVVPVHVQARRAWKLEYEGVNSRQDTPLPRPRAGRLLRLSAVEEAQEGVLEPLLRKG